MNCPTCGAANDPDARFCAECGTPLENQDIEATISGQLIQPDEEDATVVSTLKDLAAQDKTLAVDQAQVADALAEAESEVVPPGPSSPPPLESPAEPVDVEPVTPPPDRPESASPPPAAAQNGDSKKKTWLIIGIIAALAILLCCCCSLVIGGVLGNPDTVQNIMQGLSSLPIPVFMA